MGSSAQARGVGSVLSRRIWWLLSPGILGLACGVTFYLASTEIYRASVAMIFNPASEESAESVFAALDTLLASSPPAPPDNVHLQYRHEDGFRFLLTVATPDPGLSADLANLVARRLESMFVNPGIAVKDSYDLEALQRKIDAHAVVVEGHRASVASFSERFADELPGRLPENLKLLDENNKALHELDSRLESLENNLKTMKDAREKLIEARSKQEQAPPDPHSVALERLKQELQQLLEKYTEQNPSVKRKRAEIDQLLASHPSAKLKEPEEHEGPAVPPQLSARITAAEEDLGKLIEEKIQIEQRMDMYNRRIRNSSGREARLLELQEILDHAVEEHRELQEELEIARSSSEESNGQVEKGRLLIAAPAEVPVKAEHASPLFTGFLFTMLGLILGVGNITLVEYLDRCIPNSP